MSALSFAALLVLALPGGAASSEAPALPDCAPRPRHELSAELDGQLIEVCISPERSTVLVSDSPFLPGSVRLTGSERFLDLSIGRQSITLLPRRDLKPWERFELTARFADDGAAPRSVTFVLLGHPAEAARHVEVFRHPRTMASFQQEAREARAEVLRYQKENVRLRAELGRPDGLLGVLTSRLVGATGLLARNIRESVSQAPEDKVRVVHMSSYRATPVRVLEERQMGRLALAVDLLNGSEVSWMVEGAALFGPRGEVLEGVRVWQASPSQPGGRQQVFVEVEVPSPQVPGSYTLTLWDASGSQIVTLMGVTFP